MTAKHTTGPLWADLDDPAVLIRIYRGYGFQRSMVADGLRKEDAVRMVACYNACDGIDTSSLNSRHGIASELWTQHDKRVKQVQHLTSQRDELLSTLKLARSVIAECRKRMPAADHDDGIPVELFIDAAIAKAEGKSR